MKNENRYLVLDRCQILIEAQKRAISENHANLAPREGYEKAWEQLEGDIAEIKEMMTDARYERQMF